MKGAKRKKQAVKKPRASKPTDSRDKKTAEAKDDKTPLPGRQAGAMKGRISWTADAFDPLTDEELKELGFE